MTRCHTRCHALVAAVFSLLLLATPLSSRAGGVPFTQELSLAEAVQRAREHFPSIGAAIAGRDEAHAASREAVAAYLPTLRLSASATRYQEPMLVTPIHGLSLTQIPAFDETLLQAGLTLGYTLYDGGGRGARIRPARSAAAAADAALAAAEQALVARVVSAYLQTLSRRQVLEAHDHRLGALHSELSRARQLYDAGRAAEIEVLRAGAAVANAGARRVRSAAELDVVEHDLARLTSLTAEEIRSAQLEEASIADTVLAPRDSLVARALRFSPAAMEARRLGDAAEASVGATRSLLWPELKIVTNYTGWAGGDRARGTDAAEWNAGVQVGYSLFTGGATRSGIARARAASRGARERLKLVEFQLQQEIDRALSAISEAHAQVSSLAEAVASYGEVVRIEHLALETGSGTQSDYLDAEADLLEARALLAEARHAEVVARAELARIVGSLDMDWLTRTLEMQP